MKTLPLIKPQSQLLKPTAGSVWVVQGEHWDVPGRPVLVCATQERAQKEALELINIMRKDVGLPPAKNPAKHEEALQQARRRKAKELGISIADLDEDEANGHVWITEQELLSDPDTAVKKVEDELLPGINAEPAKEDSDVK